MVLKSVSIKDFLSIRGTIGFDCDPNVTILVGANDHGKSNILTAIEHVNGASKIKPDEVNWDAQQAGDEPRLEYLFLLKSSETEDFKALMSDWISRNTQGESEQEVDAGDGDEEEEDDADEDEEPAEEEGDEDDDDESR